MRKEVQVYININPKGYVRMTKRSRFTDAAKRYHAYMSALKVLYRASLTAQGLSPKLLPKGELGDIEFGIEVPSKNKKYDKRVGEYHTMKPDWDNLCKALQDSIFYGEEKDDSHVYKVGSVEKKWVAVGDGYIKFSFFI